MKFLVAILMFSAPMANAVANFSGKWVATSGKLTSQIGFNGDCRRVEIVIEQSETELITKSYKADCDPFGSDWGPSRMEIRDGKVYEEGEEVGTISDDTLISVAKSGTVAYAFNLKLVKDANGKTVMKSYYGVQNFLGAIVTEADHSLEP